jgi:hypothetical protein
MGHASHALEDELGQRQDGDLFPQRTLRGHQRRLAVERAGVPLAQLVVRVQVAVVERHQDLPQPRVAAAVQHLHLREQAHSMGLRPPPASSCPEGCVLLPGCQNLAACPHRVSTCNAARHLGRGAAHDGVQQQLPEVVDALAQESRQRDVHSQRLRSSTAGVSSRRCQWSLRLLATTARPQVGWCLVGRPPPATGSLEHMRDMEADGDGHRWQTVVTEGQPSPA